MKSKESPSSASWPDLELGSTSHRHVEPPPIYHSINYIPRGQADHDADGSDGDANEIQTLLNQPETPESNLATPHAHDSAQAHPSDSDFEGNGDHHTTSNKTNTPAWYREIIQPLIKVVLWLFPLLLYGILWLYILEVNEGDLQLKSEYSHNTTNSTGTYFEFNATTNATDMTNTTTTMDVSPETGHAGYWFSWFFTYMFNAALISTIVDKEFHTRQGKVSTPIFFLTLQTAVIPAIYTVNWWHHKYSTNPELGHGSWILITCLTVLSLYAFTHRLIHRTLEDRGINSYNLDGYFGIVGRVGPHILLAVVYSISFGSLFVLIVFINTVEGRPTPELHRLHDIASGAGGDVVQMAGTGHGDQPGDPPVAPAVDGAHVESSEVSDAGLHDLRPREQGG
ncbi:hypothetical protein BDN72DRAFT_839628 [Pluteus cervinus]|uniref:Uncharacterized protein n=1 Tax=Pluteus cervinus TaxID=181527 RepID=A0ACD3AWC0_9AGAR|nr:hypothetical protein BDN72DRAFT_839628 [Pluteus cervinus]